MIDLPSNGLATLFRREMAFLSMNVLLHSSMRSAGRWMSDVVATGGLMATFNVVPRSLSQGITFDIDMAEIDPALGAGISFLSFISGVVWANILSVTTFAVLLALAVVFRSKPETHKRFILVVTVSILGPALAVGFSLIGTFVAQSSFGLEFVRRFA